jgi:predicted enzyme related to lactoylglutathione lyase
MSDVKSYAPGTFSWVDLQTTDLAAAKKFYSDLFGWKGEDQPMPQGGAYTMARVGGKDVAGMSGLMPEQQKMGVPPHWNCYVTVTNVDDAVKKATSLGGKAVMPAMDVMDAGRMAVLEDPSGAMFCLWQSNKHMGAGKVQEHGSMAWCELETRNIDAAGGFYSKLFGWTSETQDMGNMKYTVFFAGKEQRAGMMAASPQTPPNVPSHWTVYFGVDNADETVKKAQAAKAQVFVPATDIPNVGRFAILADPQGAAFGILQSARK